MMSAANQEIRTMQRLAEERHRRISHRDLLRRMDQLVAELEEMNLANEREVSQPFFLELRELAEALPPRIELLPAPETTAEMLDYLFNLEEQLLSGRPRNLH